MSLSYFQQFSSTFELAKLYIIGKLRSSDTNPRIVKAQLLPKFIDYTSKLKSKTIEIYPLDIITIPEELKTCGQLTLFIEYTHNYQTYIYPLIYPDDKGLPFPPGKYEMTFHYSSPDEPRTPLSAVLKGKTSTKELDVYDAVMKFIGPNNDFFVSNGLVLNVCVIAEWIGWRNDGNWILEIMDDMGEVNIFDPNDILCLPKHKYNQPTPIQTTSNGV